MYSMTGYGRGNVQRDGRDMSVEIRTVNHRFLDLSLRAPRQLAFLEQEVRSRVAQRLRRGHADITLSYRNMRQDAKKVQVDTALAQSYIAALRTLKDSGIEDDLKLSHIAQLPDVMRVEESEEDQEQVLSLLQAALDLALDGVTAMRAQEGQHLMDNLSGILSEAEQKVQVVAALAPEMPSRLSERLTARLSEAMADGMEPQRIAQEVALLADRCAIDEELTRLFSHIKQLRDTFLSEGEQGRRMDFLVQEMNREVNTIASKSSDTDITSYAVALKSDIEKLREQIQNVE